MIILSGGADRPCKALDGLTPLGAATKPAMDRVSTSGRQGTARTIDPTELTDSGSALCTLLGVAEPPSDGQLRASAAGIELKPDDLALRLDLVCASDPDTEADGRSVLLAHQPAQLSTAEARVLLNDLLEHWNRELEELSELLSRVSVHVGSRGAHLLVDHGGVIAKALDESPLQSVEPERILGQPWQDAAPEGAAGELVAMLMESSHRCFEDHEINRARSEAGLLPVSMAWISGVPLVGEANPKLFESMYGMKAAMVSRSPSALGLAGLLGIDRISLPEPDASANALPERLGSLGEYARSALERYDLVMVESSVAAEAALAGDAHGKVEALELIDRAVLMPLLTRLQEEGDNEQDADRPGYRCLIACDRVIATDERGPVAEPVPFAMCGSWVRSVVQGQFNEREAGHVDLHIERASDLMEYFLFSGLKRPRSTRRPRNAAPPSPDS